MKTACKYLYLVVAGHSGTVEKHLLHIAADPGLQTFFQCLENVFFRNKKRIDPDRLNGLNGTVTVQDPPGNFGRSAICYQYHNDTF